MITTIVIFVLLIIILLITLKKITTYKHKKYFVLIIIETLCLLVEIFNLTLKKNSAAINTIASIFAIITPVIIFILEKYNIYLNEIIILFAEKNNKIDLKNVLLNIIEKYPRSYLAHKKLAEYYEKNNETKKAEDEYIKTISLRPSEYKNYYNFAKILQINKDTDNAIRSLKEALKIKPDYIEACLLLGDLLYENNDFKVAIFFYNEQLKYHPGQYELYYRLGMCYVRTNDFEEANNYYRKAARLNSYKDISSLNLGQINMILRDYDEAEKFFYEGIKSNDDKISANSYYYLAKIKILEHRYDLAIQYINMAIEIDYEIKNKIENDEQFLPILGKITMEKVPRNFKSKITKFDEETIEHLNKTYNVVETLSDYEPRENYRENEKER